MCGIAGVMMFEARDTAKAVRAVDAMIGALRHRGPDGEGTWHVPTASGGAIAFGHTRLSILDLTAAGGQPMRRGQAVVTYNGEIYNFRGLRDELRDHGERFTTGSDTEVLLAAHARWGSSLVDWLSGMFAFGLWDAAEGRLLLARDRLGVKPLYFHRGAGHFVFASEIRALLASGLVGPYLDADSLRHYLGHQTAATPATLLRDVQMVEPGHVMDVDALGRISTRRYWSLLSPAARMDDEISPSSARRRVGELLRDAVTSHLVSDVPVGVFLSGGIDSGALVSVLSEAGVRAHSVTVGLDDDPAADESADARLLARTFGTDHTELRIRGDDILDTLPRALAAVDHPSGDGINTFVVSKAVRESGLKVALSGLGGDEVFGGYASFRRLQRLMPAVGRVSKSPAAIRRVAADMVRTAGGGRVATDKAAAVIESNGTLADVWPVTRQVFSERDQRRMLGHSAPAGSAQTGYTLMLAAAFADAPHAGLWARISYAEARGYMHDVLLRDADQMGMAHGLEIRVPLLDAALAAYVVSLPDHVKAEGRTAKSLLVDSLTRPLPAALASKKKRGFVLPFDQWMRGPLRDFCERQLGEQGLDGRGVFRPGEATRVWTRFLERANGVTWSRVWTLVALNAWLDRQNVRIQS